MATLVQALQGALDGQSFNPNGGSRGRGILPGAVSEPTLDTAFHAGGPLIHRWYTLRLEQEYRKPFNWGDRVSRRAWRTRSRRRGGGAAMVLNLRVR